MTSHVELEKVRAKSDETNGAISAEAQIKFLGREAGFQGPGFGPFGNNFSAVALIVLLVSSCAILYTIATVSVFRHACWREVDIVGSLFQKFGSDYTATLLVCTL